MEKYIFVSETTVPAKPWKIVWNALTANWESDLCISRAGDWPSTFVNGKKLRLVKHHQWAVLNRDHAKVLAAQWQTKPWRDWVNLGQKAYSMGYTPAFCADEVAPFAAIFGAREPPVPTQDQGWRHYDGLGSINGNVSSAEAQDFQGRCRTLTAWSDTLNDFSNHNARDVLLRAMAADPASILRPSNRTHPIVFERLGWSSLLALRASPYLFARKVMPGAWLPNFADIVFALNTG